MTDYTNTPISDLMAQAVPLEEWPDSALEGRLEDVRFFIEDGEDQHGEYAAEEERIENEIVRRIRNEQAELYQAETQAGA